jgi:GNAT superfamily N-acetyltransferase
MLDLMFRVRPFSDGDRQAAETIYRSCRAEASWLPPAAKETSDFARDTAGEKLLVAVGSDDIPLGFLSAWEPDSFIHHLYVRSDMRGQGVGKALLKSLGAQLPKPWRLKCLNGNGGALAFYESQGWKKVSSEVGEEGPYFVLEKQTENMHGPPLPAISPLWKLRN